MVNTYRSGMHLTRMNGVNSINTSSNPWNLRLFCISGCYQRTTRQNASVNTNDTRTCKFQTGGQHQPLVCKRGVQFDGQIDTW